MLTEKAAYINSFGCRSHLVGAFIVIISPRTKPITPTTWPGLTKREIIRQKCRIQKANDN